MGINCALRSGTDNRGPLSLSHATHFFQTSLLPYPAAVRQAAQFFHGIEHDFVRHIRGDFDFPNFSRQYKMDRAVLRFLVGLYASENLAGAHFQFRQAAEAQDSVSNTARSNAVGAPYRKSDVGCGDQSPGDGLAVEQATVARFRLQRVSDGMSQVQNAA